MQNYKKILIMIDDLNKQLFGAYSSYYLHFALNDCLNKDIKGETLAQRNVDTANLIPQVYKTLQHTTYESFVIGLAKFFDNNKRNQTKSFFYLFQDLVENLEELNTENFLKIFEGRDYFEDLTEAYVGFKKGDIEALRDGREKHDDAIKRLIILRNQYVAHSDQNPKEVSLSREEIEGVFSYVEETLNTLSSILAANTTMHDNARIFAEKEVDTMLRLICYGKHAELRYIEDEYERNIINSEKLNLRKKKDEEPKE